MRMLVFGLAFIAALSSLSASAEPAKTATTDKVAQKWATVKTQLMTETKALSRCSDKKECPPAAQRFVEMLDKGRAFDGLRRLQEVNRLVNLSVGMTGDLEQWGVGDRWSPPFETLSTRKGDCEDIAILKFALLRALKVGVRMVLVHDALKNEDHAVVEVYYHGAWQVLDNVTLDIVAMNRIQHYQVLRTLH